jgi:EKC/KEOPS complex subunit CGI121/TPRKB
MAFGTFTLTADTDPAHLFYFTDVTNAKQLKERLQAGDDRLAYAFIDGRSILSQFHLLVAARRAVEALRDQRLKTHNVHSEIVYNLAPDTNIGNALRHFGIAEDTKAMAVIKISKASREVIEADLVTLIQGTATHIDRIGADVDLQRIRKVIPSQHLYTLHTHISLYLVL